jgi:hypothetical protein
LEATLRNILAGYTGRSIPFVPDANDRHVLGQAALALHALDGGEDAPTLGLLLVEPLQLIINRAVAIRGCCSSTGNFEIAAANWWTRGIASATARARSGDIEVGGFGVDMVVVSVLS